MVPLEAVMDVVAVQGELLGPRGGCDCLALHVIDLAAAHRWMILALALVSVPKMLTEVAEL